MHTEPIAAITIRPLSEGDRDAVARLAQLDSKRPLEGDLLGAEVEGRLLAAIAVATGDAISDPFSRTTEILGMLELRRAHLRGRKRAGRRRLRVPRRAPRSRAALAGSPPGAGGRLLTLPPRAY